MVSSTLLSAIVQALVLAATLMLTLVGITLWFSGRFSDITSSINSMADSISAVEESVRDVDLKEIEKTVLRLEYELGTEVEGDNSVSYELPRSGIGVTISLAEEVSDDVADPIRHTDPVELVERATDLDELVAAAEEDVDRENVAKQFINDAVDESEDLDIDPSSEIKTRAELSESEVTYLAIEFDERISSKTVTNKLSNDKHLEEIEIDLFGYECGFTALSPIEIQFSVPTGDYELIAEWLDDVLDKIDQYHTGFVEEAEEFDAEVESVLKEK